MTANEMANRVEIELDRLTNFSSPGYEDDELSEVLTKSQWYYIKNTLNWKNNKLKEGFEETEVRRQGLSELIKDSVDPSSTGTAISSTQTGTLKNGVFFDLPNDFMIAIMEEATTDKNNCTTTDDKIVAPIYVVSHDEYTKNITNPYKQPYAENNYGIVWRMNYSREISGFDNATISTQTPKRHEVITDGTFNITDYHIRYLKIPYNIIVDRTTPTNQRHCELDESAQETIIDLTVEMLKEITDRQDLKNVQPLSSLE